MSSSIVFKFKPSFAQLYIISFLYLLALIVEWLFIDILVINIAISALLIYKFYIHALEILMLNNNSITQILIDNSSITTHSKDNTVNHYPQFINVFNSTNLSIIRINNKSIVIFSDSFVVGSMSSLNRILNQK